MAATLGVNEHIFGAFERFHSDVGAGAPIIVLGGPSGLTGPDVERIKNAQGVGSILPIASALVPLPGMGESLLVLGVAPDARGSLRSTFLEKWATPPSLSRVLGLSPWLVLEQAAADRLRVQVGDRIELPSPRGRLSFVLAGTFHGGKAARAVFGNLALALPSVPFVLNGSRTFDRVEVFPLMGASERNLVTLLGALLPGAEVQLGMSRVRGAESAFAHMGPGLLLAAFTAVLAGAFLVFNVHSVGLEERRGQFATVRALGGSSRQIFLALLGEGLFVGVVGAIFGVLLGAFAAGLAVRAFGDNLPLVAVPGAVGFRLPGVRSLLFAALAGVASTLFAVFLSGSGILRQPPARLMRRQIDGSLRSPGRAARALVVGFVVIAALLGFVRSGSESSAYLVIGVLAIGFALLGPLFVPVLLYPMLKLALNSARLRLALLNLLRHSRRTGLSVSAVGLAAALGVQSSAVVESFREEILSWVRSSMTGDLFIIQGSPRLASGRNQPFDSGFLQSIRSTPGVLAARGVRGAFVPCSGETVYLVGLDFDAYDGGPSMRWVDGSWSDAMPKLLSGTGVLVSDNFAALTGKRVQDRIELKGKDGLYAIEIAGVVTDYSWGRGTILMDRSALVLKHRLTTLDLVVIKTSTGTDVINLRERIRADHGRKHDLFMATSQEFRDMVMEELSSLFNVAGAQKIVVLVLGFLAILNTIALSVLARAREFAVLSAIGASPRWLRGVAQFEGGILAAMGTGLGLALGCLITVILMRDLLDAASGWSLPVRLPWGLILSSLGLSIVGGVLAGQWATKISDFRGFRSL